MKMIGDSDSEGDGYPYTETIFTLTIVVKTPSNKEEVTLFTLKNTDTISHLKTLIKSKEGVPKKRQFLIHNGILLHDYQTLSTSGLESWSIVCAIFCPEEIVCPTMNALHVFVKMPEWTELVTVQVQVQAWYDGRDFKAVMESSTGLFLDHYVVSRGGTLIDESARFCDWNVNEEMPIYLLCKGRKFQVVAKGCGWEELVMVCESDTVGDVKKMVESFAQVESERMVLFRGGDDMIRLEDEGKPVVFYDVVEKSTIWVLGLAMKLTIKMPQSGDVLSLSAYGVKNVRGIKSFIFEKMGIPFSCQKLFHRGVFLADEDETLQYYGVVGVNCDVFATFGSGDDDHKVEELEKLNLSFKGDPLVHVFKVKCSTCGESESESDDEESDEDLFDIELKSSNTILDVKTAVQSLQNFPVFSQQLYFGETLLKDWKNLSEYRVTKWLLLGSQLTMFVETPNHKKVVVKASSTNPVHNILDMIPKQALDNINWKPSLFLDGIYLPEHKTLVQLSVKSGSVLWLDRLVQIDVTRPNGAIIHVNVNLSYTIKAVKEKIERECGIPVGLQRLAYGGDELDEDMTLGQYEEVLGNLWALRWNFCHRSWSFFYPSYQVNKTRSDMSLGV